MAVRYKKNPLVSVIIPNYNHARYQPERIESVLGQAYSHFEIIILDDCSTDNSREVIERYRANPHVSKIVYNEVNSGGVFKQWKKGISLAKGELVWIAESDDKCEYTFLERLVDCFNKDSSLSLAFCKSLQFDDKGNTWQADSKELCEGVYDSRTFINKYMSRGCVMLNASACLFSKRAFEAIDDRYTGFRCSGDYMFWTQLSEQGNIAVVEDPLNHYRKHNSNTTKDGFHRGVNQKESKLVLDYIWEKGYINRKEYNQIRRDFLKQFVFELLEDSKLKNEIYDYWHFNRMQQFSLRLEAWLHKLKRIA